jgi:cell wall-associated NlpC family hydrolase
VLVAGAVAALLLLALPAGPAHAGPSVSQIEAQISQLWAQAEPMIEKYNSVHDQYVKNKAQLAAMQKKIQPLELQVELGQVRVGAIAASAYMGQGANTFNALLSAGSPAALADQLAFIDVLARQQTQQIAGVAEMKRTYDAQKAPLDALNTTLSQQDKDLAAQKNAINAQLDQLQQLRRQAYGTTADTGAYRPWLCPAEYAPTNGYKAALFACHQAGAPYVWATAGPNTYDCSGLTMAAWASVGVYMPHNALAQRQSMPAVTRANLQVGDLVFYYDDTRHVAIYVGDDKVMQAPFAGDNVRMSILEDVGPVVAYGRPQ